METLILLAVVIAAVLIINTLSGKITELHFRFDALNHELRKLKDDLEAWRRAAEAPQPTAWETKFKEAAPAPPSKPALIPQPLPPEQEKPLPAPAPVPAARPLESPPPPTAPEPDKPTRLEQPEEIAMPVAAFNPVSSETAHTTISQNPEPVPAGAYEPVLEPSEADTGGGSFFDNFTRNNPDLEKFIGENLINKIGIAILVLGIGYFVKFAIDKDWINEIGRVFIGILAGGLLIGVAHRLRNSFSAFSSVLVGGGLAVLYFTIAIAFHEYQLLSQTAAFLVMAVITGFSVLLSVTYNRVELAVLALLGGFATPFMVSTGEGNYQVLFTYILILNVGMLVLAYLKDWKIINWITYGFTILLFGGWLSTKVFNRTDGPYLGAFVFASLFYLVFFLMNIVGNLKKQGKFQASDIGILLSNTFLYYSAGMTLLYQIQGGLYQGLFTVAVAVVNFIFAFVLYRNQKVDRNLIYLLVGLVVTFISLAVPVQLEGNYITLFWALEAVLLLWLSQKSGLKIVAFSSIIVTGLMLISLFMDWVNIYMQNEAGPLRILLNKGFVTSVVAMLSLMVTRHLLRNQDMPLEFSRYQVDFKLYARGLAFAFTALLYLSLILELHYQLGRYVESPHSRSIIMGTYNLAFIAGLMLFATYKNYTRLVYWTIGLGVFGLVLYVSYWNFSVLGLLKAHYLYGVAGFTGFPFHYLNLILAVVLMVLIYRHKPVFETYWPNGYTAWLWFCAFVTIFLASSELLYHVLWLNLPAPQSGVSNPDLAVQTYAQYERLVQQTNKVGFPILWGICAFTYMFIGLGRKNKTLRIISLSLFGLTLAKLFLYDIRGISESGKSSTFTSEVELLLFTDCST